MPGYYTYLISSLPMLQLGMKIPFSFETFLEICSESISPSDMEILKACTGLEESVYDRTQTTMKKWHAFDTALRNALVKIRASRKHIDPSRFLREDSYEDPAITNLAMNAYKNPSILESEEMLDKERWRALDELDRGHYFDLDSLIIYAHKLLTLERWERIRTSDKSSMIEEVI